MTQHLLIGHFDEDPKAVQEVHSFLGEMRISCEIEVRDLSEGILKDDDLAREFKKSRLIVLILSGRSSRASSLRRTLRMVEEFRTSLIVLQREPIPGALDRELASELEKFRREGGFERLEWIKPDPQPSAAFYSLSFIVDGLLGPTRMGSGGEFTEFLGKASQGESTIPVEGPLGSGEFHPTL